MQAAGTKVASPICDAPAPAYKVIPSWTYSLTCAASSPMMIGQGRKSLRPPRASCWVDLKSKRFDAVADASELSDHSGSAYPLQPFAHGLAAFLIADPSVQDDPDQPTKAISNCPDGLIVPQA